MLTNLESDREHAARWWHGGRRAGSHAGVFDSSQCGLASGETAARRVCANAAGTSWWQGNV